MIDSNINKLISIAERQSDQRLAQELNPQTQTGLLGPAFISASELSYRKKIRDEAQAQPMRSPSIVQQLAQSAMSPMQPMPTAPMPMQQPMPMPQQPMQRFNNGGIVFGNPYLNLVEGEATDVLGNYPFDFDDSGRLVRGPFVSDDSSALLPSTDTRADELIQEAEIEKNKIGPPSVPFLQEEYNKLLEFNERKQQEIADRNKKQEEERRKRNIQVDQDKLLSPLRPPQADPLAGQIASPGAELLVAPPKDNSPLDLRINPRQIDLPQAPDTRDIQSLNPQDIIKMAGPAAVPPSNEDVEDAIVRTGTDPDAANKNNLDANKQKQLSDDDKALLGNVKTMVSSGVGSAAQKDIAYAASSDYQDLINKSIAKMTDEKGRMQNKWLRIAAGAFNAAQKGSPTLLGGLADLGAGVTEQLLALDADEQKQAQELFALYSAREKLRLDSYNSKYDLQRNERTDYATNVKSYNADLARLLNTEISDDFEEQDAYAELAIQYADMGIKPAQYRYARFVKEIAAKQDEINNKPDISETEARQELQSYLEDNKHLKLIYDNYMDRGDVSQEEWIDTPLPGLRERSV